MNRRGFLQSILAAGVAPAIVKADNLMRVYVPEKKILIAQRKAIEIPIPKGWRSSAPSYIDIKKGKTVLVKRDGFVMREYSEEFLRGFNITEKIYDN